MKKILWITIVSLCIGVAGNACATLLTNGGFEADTSSTPAGWTDFGGAPHQAFTAGWAASEGTNGFWMKAWNANKDGGIYQDVSATEGSIYTLDGSTSVTTNFVNNGGTLQVSLIFLNGVGGELSRVSNRWDEVDEYTTNQAHEPMATLQACAPLQTATARVEIHWTTDAVIEQTGNASPMADGFVLTESAFGLLNGGFELDQNVPPTNWTAFGNSNFKAQNSGFATSVGTNGCWMQGWVENRDGGIYQDVAAAPGFNYTLNGDMKVETGFQASSGTVSIAVQCLDASDTVLDQASHIWSLGAYPGTTGFFTIDPLEITWAPATTAKVRARLYLATQSVGAEGSCMADDLSLTAEFVPRGTLITIQ